MVKFVKILGIPIKIEKNDKNKIYSFQINNRKFTKEIEDSEKGEQQAIDRIYYIIKNNEKRHNIKY